MQRLANRKILKRILFERKGLFVPIQSHDHYLTDQVCQRMKVGDLEVHRIRSHEEPRMREAKDFMLNTFYQEAPIPQALKLGDPTSGFSFQNNQLTKAFLEKEMKMYMASGASVVYRSRGQCVAVNFSCVWERNPAYEVLDERFDATLWHNVAADLAAEDDNPLTRNIIWRDFQFQHLYNLAQRLMEKSGKSKTLYVGALFFSPALRDLGLSVALVKALSNHYSNSDSLLLCQSNFRAFDKFILKQGKNPRVAEFVRYDDEELVLDDNEGRRAFSMLSKLDGIKFYTDQ